MRSSWDHMDSLGLAGQDRLASSAPLLPAKYLLRHLAGVKATAPSTFAPPLHRACRVEGFFLSMVGLPDFGQNLISGKRTQCKPNSDNKIKIIPTVMSGLCLVSSSWGGVRLRLPGLP